jgi:hypothetical protein
LAFSVRRRSRVRTGQRSVNRPDCRLAHLSHPALSPEINGARASVGHAPPPSHEGFDGTLE